MILAAPLACGAPPEPSTPAGADPIPVHGSFTIDSRAIGEPRPINVWIPASHRDGAVSGSSALPVLYMPDGGVNEDFPHVVNTVESLLQRGAIRPFLVVGIPNTQRRRDLTSETSVATDREMAPAAGGSPAFRRFLREELLPEIERRYPTTPERAIVGESLAGRFIVEVFLEDPSLFTHYVALDPSLWWNAGALVESAAARLAAFDEAPRSLYLAGSGEEIPPGSDRLAAIIRASPRPTLRFRYDPRPDLTHATIFRALEAAALEFALR